MPEYLSADGEDVGGVRDVGAGAVFVCIFVGTLMLSAALGAGGRAQAWTKETIFAVERTGEAVHYIGHAERDKRHCAVASSLPPLALFLWTHFSAPISLGPAKINEEIRGMLLNSFDMYDMSKYEYLSVRFKLSKIKLMFCVGCRPVFERSRK